MQTRWRRWQRLALGVLAAATVALGPALVLAPTLVLAQGADDLALNIEQNLAGIEFRLELRPERAATELEAQKRQLDLLEQEAPDHPALPGLKQKFAELQTGLADALADAVGDASQGGGAGQVPTAPEGFTAGMEEVAALQQRAEAEFMIGNTERAGSYLGEAEAQMSALENRYRSEIPQGHVPLLVAREKQAVLEQQLAEEEAQ